MNKRVQHPTHGRGTLVLMLSEAVGCVDFDRDGPRAVGIATLTLK